LLVPPCPIKGQFYTAECFAKNATCDDPNPTTICDYPHCVCPRGQVIDEETNTCISGAECCKYKFVLIFNFVNIGLNVLYIFQLMPAVLKKFQDKLITKRKRGG